MSKSTKAAGKRHTIASVADEVAELRSGLAEVLSLLKSEAAEQPVAEVREAAELRVTEPPSLKHVRDRHWPVGTEELRGEEINGDSQLLAITAAAESARKQIREEFKQVRTAIEVLLGELPEEEGQ